MISLLKVELHHIVAIFYLKSREALLIKQEFNISNKYSFGFLWNFFHKHWGFVLILDLYIEIWLF